MSYESNGPFQDVHPSQTGRQPLGTLAGQDLPAGSTLAKPNESRWIRCYQCGFPVDTERHQLGNQQPGISIVATTQTATGQDNVSVDSPVVSSGCPFCGASESAWGPR